MSKFISEILIHFSYELEWIKPKSKSNRCIHWFFIHDIIINNILSTEDNVKQKYQELLDAYKMHVKARHEQLGTKPREENIKNIDQVDDFDVENVVDDEPKVQFDY